MKTNQVLKTTFVVFFFSFLFSLHSSSAMRVEPGYWWAGMHMKEIMVLVNEPEIGNYTTATTSQPGVKIIKAYTKDSKNYLFIELSIAKNAAIGSFNITVKNVEGKTKNIPFEVKARSGKLPKAITQNDIMYLIMPDRFANADTSNDYIAALGDKLDRKNQFARHGGDLKGIASKLDYLNDLGITTMWINPVIENANKNGSYHGYGFTNFYEVDARFGSHSDYAKLVTDAHNKGIKTVKDLVLNHIGIGHSWMTDIPVKKWVRYYGEKPTLTNFKLSAMTDPHASESDYNKMQRGWFVNSLPDLDQTDPLLERYLIQNTLWWIESVNLDGIRLDTYPYSEKPFLINWHKAIEKEYLNFFIVGEIWINNVPNEAYYLKNATNQDGFKGGLLSTTDFPLSEAISNALRSGGRRGGSNLNEVYEVLSQDFMYANAGNNLIFLDNHDIARFMHIVGNDLQKMKLGLTLLMTTRGIPQIYYGTELLMNGNGDHDKIRYDVPGGWASDTISSFSEKGRSANQNEVFNLIRKLNQLRKGSKAIGEGKLIHFIPENNIYVYFRQLGSETLMVVLNGNAEPRKLDLSRFDQFLKGKQKLSSPINTNKEMNIPKEIELQPLEAEVYKVF
jgi:glycosidase